MVDFSVLLIIIIFSVLSVLQATVALGKPFGRFVWGGQHDVLPVRLRIGSAVSIVMYCFFMLVALQQAEVVSIEWFAGVSQKAIWPITVYLGIGIVMNAISRSKAERYTMTPVIATACFCFYMIAST